MLWTLAVAVLWILGLVGVYGIGAWIWLFFAIWIISLIAQLASGHGHGTATSATEDASRASIRNRPEAKLRLLCFSSGGRAIPRYHQCSNPRI